MGKDLKGREIGVGIRQLAPNRYEGRYVNRYKARKSVYGTTLAEVRRNLKEAIANDLAFQSVKKRIKLKDWYKHWMEIYKIPNVRPSTVILYEGVYKRHIEPELGEMYLDDIESLDVVRVVNSLKKRGYGWDTQNKVKILILNMFKYAIENHFATSDPTKGIRITRPEEEERVILNRGEQKDFLEIGAGTFYNNLYVVMLNSGLRPGEAYALTEEDLDFEKHFIHVRHTLLYATFEGDTKRSFHLGPPKTDDSVRPVPMNKTCEYALRKQLKLKTLLAEKYPVTGELAPLIFVTRYNEPLCTWTVSESIKKLVMEVNAQRDALECMPFFTPHTFRHTFATRCIEGGMKPKTLQKILGHSSLSTTMDMYVHVTLDWMVEEMQHVEKMMPTYYYDDDEEFDVGFMEDII